MGIVKFSVKNTRVYENVCSDVKVDNLAMLM
jgi:hypothetical protein